MKIAEKDYQKIMEKIDADKEEIISFLSALVKCKTPSSIGDTREAVALIRDFFQKRGILYEELAYCKTMPNIISSFSTAKEGKHLMLNGHLDVMPAGNEPGWLHDPWSGIVEDGKVWGRGTSDMKAGDVAMLFAYAYLYEMRDKLSGKLSISLVADEETGWGRGTGFLFDTKPDFMMADCVLSGEPSGIDAVSFASKGYMMISVKVQTRGAIAGYSHESKNAIEIVSDMLRDFKQLEKIQVDIPEELQSLLDNPEWRNAYGKIRNISELEQLRKITVDVCTIKGGSLSVVIPADCKFTLSIVFPQGTDVDLLKNRVNEIAEKYPEAKLSIDGIDMPEASEKNGEMPQLIQDVAEKIGLKRPILTPEIAISDCRYWRYRNIPAYWYGPGGEACSAANESIKIEDLLNVVRVHTITAFEYLQK